ncbi:ATP-dependent helicase [Oenococcus sp. UCMA 16435]|nr:ATP-dependent helicase [Oenococcus sp. UCMA 16435]
MTLEIVRGFADKDFRSELLERIYEKYRADPEARFFYIVPNHIKFSAEVDVLKKFGLLLGQNDQEAEAFSRLQVYSLSRLAWALTKERDQKTTISNQAISILVGQVLRELPIEKLSIFARSARMPGFVANVAEQLLEIWRSGLTATEILSLHQSSDRLSEKIKVLALIEVKILPSLKNYSLADDALRNFAAQISQIDLKNCNFYFEGFSGFTASELSLVKALLAADRKQQLGKNSEIVLSLLGDQQSERYGQGNLFYKANQLFKDEFSLAKIRIASNNRPLSGSQLNLERSWRELETQGFTNQKRSFPQTKIVVTSDREHEIDFVARSIRQRLVNDPKLRAKNILVLAQRLGEYKNIIPKIFDRYDLPYFLDKDIRMSDHPLASLIENLLGPFNEFAYDRIMKIFRTGLFSWQLKDDFQTALDYLENYLLANNPKEKAWRQEEFQLIQISDEQDLSNDQKIDRQINRLINQMHHFILEILDDFQDKFARVENYHQAVKTLYSWLTDRQVDRILLSQANDGDDRGLQTWKLLISTLNEVDQLIGDKEYSQKDFLQILKDGFAAASFSGIPASLDQITVSESGIVQRNDFKILYFIDASDASLPAQTNSNSLIDDFDRLQLIDDFSKAKKSYYLQDTSRQQMTAENFRFYSSVLSATDAVVFSYSKLKLDGKQNELSPYLRRLALKNVSDLEIKKIPDLPRSQADLINYLGTPNSSAAILSQSAQNFGENFIDGLIDLLIDRNPHFQKILQALHYTNQSVTLRSELINKLFGEDLRLSISQIEKYYSNPYEYFLQYGLRLKKRNQFMVDAALSGTYYHSIFEQVINRLIGKATNFHDLNDQELEKLSQRSAHDLIELPDFQILQSDDHFRAVATSLADDVLLTLKLMHRANALNHSRPIKTEAIFGKLSDDQKQEQSLAGLDFTLANGHKIYLRGKVDRIDQQDLEHLFGTIIDYKSNGKVFDFRDAYVGTELQLLTYWLALSKNSSRIGINQTGGAVFVQIRNKPTDISQALARQIQLDQLIGDRAQQQAPDFQFHGLLLDDQNYLTNLQAISAGQRAKYYNFGLTKKGQNTARSDLISKEDLTVLLKHDEKKLVEAGNKIIHGEFPLFPIKKNEQRSALTYSDYTEIMNFDRNFGNQYNNLNRYPKNKNELISKMREEEGEN